MVKKKFFHLYVRAKIRAEKCARNFKKLWGSTFKNFYHPLRTRFKNFRQQSVKF